MRYVQSPQSLTVHISITGQLKMENLELTMLVRCCVDVDTEDWPVGHWARHDEVRIFE